MILVSPTKTESTQLIIYGIKKGDKLIIERVYNDYFHIISSYVTKNSGSIEDAKDIFQEALIVIYHNCGKEDFKLDCMFSTYLYAICKNIWLKHLRKNHPQTTEISNLVDKLTDVNVENDVLEAKCYELYLSKFELLSTKCQEMLRLYFAKVDMKSIAKSLNLSSESYAKKKKFKCKEQLIRTVKKELNTKIIQFDELQ